MFYVLFPYSLALNPQPNTTAESPAVLPVPLTATYHLLPTTQLAVGDQPTLPQHSERSLNSCALLNKLYSCNFNHTFMYRLDWWKNKLLLLLLLLLLL
jgi:hypothetical protein